MWIKVEVRLPSGSLCVYLKNRYGGRFFFSTIGVWELLHVPSYIEALESQFL
jgi:hypothetical protein